MAEIRCCRFHRWFVLLLVLAAWSLVSHFFVDTIHPPHEQSLTVQMQPDREHRVNNQEVGHASGLHGGYILSEIPACAAPKPAIHIGEIPDSFGRVWIPPTPFRPPITLSI